MCTTLMKTRTRDCGRLFISSFSHEHIVSFLFLKGVARSGDFKLIWGQAKLLDKHRRRKRKHADEKFRQLKNQYLLFNVKEDPFERRPLSLDDNADVVKELKTLIMEEYPMTTFPSYHQNVEEAYPGNNDGNLVTGWC